MESEIHPELLKFQQMKKALFLGVKVTGACS